MRGLILVKQIALITLLSFLTGLQFVDAQSFADSFHQNLPQGGRELLCPHTAAREVGKFWAGNESSAGSEAKLLYTEPSKKKWSYIRLSSASVPTLKEDGSSLDFTQPNQAQLVAYIPQSGAAQKAFWSHRYNNGEIVSASDHLVKEGVDDLREIKQSIKASDFCLIRADANLSKTQMLDAIWTNSIFVKEGNAPTSGRWADFKRINEQLLDALPPQDIQHLTDLNATFVTTSTSNSGENLVTVYRGSDAAHFRYLVGELFSFKRADSASFSALMASLRQQTKGRLYVYGDELPAVDFEQIARDNNLEMIRRGSTVTKSFVRADRQLTAIEKRKSPHKMAALNGIPGTEKELEAMNKPSSGVETWRQFRSKVNERLAGKISERIKSRQELFRELTSGDSDVLFLMAHFDGKAIYFGEERVELAELEKLQPVRRGDKPRVAVLVTCNAGRLASEAKSILRRGVKSLGELFIRKGFFEKVIAPDHEIESEEGLEVLSAALNSSAISRSGWLTLADADAQKRILE